MSMTATKATTYVCPKCGRSVVVLLPVIEVICGRCPSRRPREQFPVMKPVESAT